MNMTKTLSVVLCCLACTASAKTNYVNKSMADYTGHDGTTPELAFRTIQEGINASATGDTVMVAPGEYGADQGLGRDDTERGKSRVFVDIGSAVTRLQIKSSGGAAVTSIVGLHDGTTGHFGTGAVRCVDVRTDDIGNNTLVIEGFTFKDGATVDSQEKIGCAGAVYACHDQRSDFLDPRRGTYNYGVYLVDCVLSNCIGARAQLTIGCTLVRCRIQDNVFVKPTGNLQIDGISRFINCLVTRNRAVDATGAAWMGEAYWYDQAKFVNCSFVDNQLSFYCWSPCSFYNCVDALSLGKHNDGSADHLSNHVVDTATTRNLIAPSLGDYRLHEGCAALTAGDPAYLNDVGISRKTLYYGVDYYKDLDGNAIATEGAIAAGCSQASVPAAAGIVVGADKNVEFGTRSFAQFDVAWIWPTAYPTTYTVSVRAEGEGRLYSYLLNADGITAYADLSACIVYPTDYRNDTLALRPHPTDATTVGYKRATPGDANCKLVYLDAGTKEADGDQNGSSDHPYRTIAQAAATVAYNKYAVFAVRPGDYDAGVGSTSVNSFTIRGRLALDDRGARLVAVEGPATTAIVGAPDEGALSGDDNGCGPDAIGITALKRGDVAIQGFTLKDAYSGTGTYAKDGVTYSYEPARLVITDSILTGNRGAVTALASARYVRCRVTDNTGKNGLFAANACVISSIIDNNTVTDDQAHYFNSDYTTYTPFVFGSTFLGDGDHMVFWNFSKGRFLNSIFAQGGRVAGQALSETFAGCVMNGFQSELWPSGVTYAKDVMFGGTSGADGNFRVFVRSPAATAGTYDADTESGVLRQLVLLDYTGKVRENPTAGAFDETLTSGIYVSAGAGVAVASDGQIGYNGNLEDGDVLTLGYAAGSTRPLGGYAVDGVTNLIEKATDVIAVTYHEGEANLVEAVYSNDWYVDDVNGSDSTGLGYNPACAFKTLKKGLSNASLKAKDRVLVAPGTYDDETMIQDGDFVLAARAVVPANVTLKASGTAAETIIEGAPCTPGMEDAAPGETSEGHMTGFGKDAIRGVYLGAGATLEGFTIRGGFTRGSTDAGTPDYGGVDYTGGAVRTADATARIVRCRLEGNNAFRGGALYAATAVDCVFTNNTALYAGGASSDSHIYGSISVDNHAFGTPRAGGHFYWQHLENCTILDSVNGTGWVAGSANVGVMKNCLCAANDYTWWNANDGYPGVENIVNCVFVPPVHPYDGNSGYVYECIVDIIKAGVGNIVTTLDRIQMDADFRPVVGANLAIDAGVASLNSSYVGSTDLSGVQRVYNGTMDIGALEADWRATYARDISRKASVSAASPDVVEGPDKSVVLPDGAALTAQFDLSRSDYDLTLRVAGGALTVKTGDGIAVYTSDTTVRFVQSSEPLDISFSYAGTDCVQIGRMTGLRGLLLLVR